MELGIYHLSLAALATFVLVALQRLFLHPLSKVPGPRIAAITHFYKGYYLATGGSKIYLQIEKLHEKYGM